MHTRGKRASLIVSVLLSGPACATTSSNVPAPQPRTAPQESTDSACDALVADLKTSDFVKQGTAADALGALGAGGQCGVDALRVATRYTVREVRARAVRALGNIGPTALSAAPDLMEAVFAFEDTPSASVAEDAIEALPKLGPGVIPYMLPWLEIVPDDDGEDTKGTWGVAAVVLGKVGAPAVPALIEAMRVPSRRKGAADALGRVGPAAAMAVATLTRVYKQDDDPYLRFSIVEALGSIGSSAAPAVPLLVDAYNNDRDLTRRIETVVALGKIGPAAAAAIPLLEHIASDRGLPRELTTPAKKALRQVRGEQVQ